jgi:hypothetical protein
MKIPAMPYFPPSQSKGHQLPDNWRERLPDPGSYYAQRVHKLSHTNSSGWAQGRCPFHEDTNASLSVNVDGERGNWKCFAGCGGGDLVSFHMLLTGLEFKAAIRDLIGLSA